MTISSAQCRAGRALLGWSRDYLAAAAGVGKRTIVDFERDARSPQASTVLALRIAFEAAGVTFLAENDGGTGVLISKPAAGEAGN